MATNRTFGIEIEAYNATHEAIISALSAVGVQCRAEGYNHQARNHWKIVSDSSIVGRNAFELVSPVLSGADGREQVRKALNALSSIGVKVNRSCGMHVHMGVSDLSVKQIRNVCKGYVRSESLLDLLMPASRRGNNAYYCQGWAHTTVPEVFEALNRAQEVSGLALALNQDRYCKVNLTSFARQGTVEFRQHAGTVNAEKAIAWIDLLDSLIDDAANSPEYRPWQEGCTLKLSKFMARLPGLSLDTRNFLNTRARELNRTPETLAAADLAIAA